MYSFLTKFEEMILLKNFVSLLKFSWIFVSSLMIFGKNKVGWKNQKIDKKSVHDIIIIKLAIEFKYLLLNWRIINPSDMILELSCDEKSRLSNDFSPNSYMTLLNKSHRLFHGLSILKLTKKNGQSSSTECRNRYFFGCLNILSGSNNSHIVELLE